MLLAPHETPSEENLQETLEALPLDKTLAVLSMTSEYEPTTPDVEAIDAAFRYTGLGSPVVAEPGSGGTTTAPDFRGGRDPRPSDIFIAVMGVTGSGKSSFISLCSKQFVKIGHDLSSCTSTVDVYAYDMTPESTVYLIDTPGFDDTNKSDTEVLREIATWLGSSYTNKVLLHGIIYLHRITDMRMQGSAKKNLIMFKKLCGQDALRKVILVTTMWDKVAADEATKREGDLVNTAEFWGWMMEKGSSCCRHFNTLESARQIVHLLTKHSSPITTNIQRELVDERRTLDDTSAGRELQSERLKERQKWATELKEVEEGMKEAIRQRDREAEELMREERDRYTRMIKNAESEVDSLRLTMESLLAERDKRVASIEKRMEEQQAAHKQELRSIALEHVASIEKRMKDQEEAHKKELRELKEKQSQLERAKTESRWVGEGSASQHSAAMSKSIRVQGLFGPEYPYFSVALYGKKFFGKSPTCLHSDFKHPGQSRDGMDLQAVSFGKDEGGAIWVARFQKGSQRQWVLSKQDTSQFRRKIDRKGRSKLDFCAIGPEPTFYARWSDGSWDCDASENTRTKLAEIHEEGKKLFAICWGIGGSSVMSYGRGTNLYNLGWRYDLQGHYPKLMEFLDSNKRLSVQAVALNPMNSTDFVIIYSREGNNTCYAKWNIEDKDSLKFGEEGSLLSRIEAWWDATCQ